MLTLLHIEPILVEGALVDETVIGLQCGDCHTMAVTTNGSVWGWGCFKVDSISVLYYT